MAATSLSTLGNGKLNVILAKTEDSESISRAIASVSFGDGEPMYWMTVGAPTLVFLKGSSVIAAIRCLLPGYVRCEELWDGDVKLLDDGLLADLLVDFASNSVTAAMALDRSLPQIARKIRSDYELSPMGTYRALRQAGLPYIDSKSAVDSTLNATEESATQTARSQATEALYER